MPQTDGCHKVPSANSLERGRGCRIVIVILSYCSRELIKTHLRVWFCGGSVVSSERNQPVAASCVCSNKVKTLSLIQCMIHHKGCFNQGQRQKKKQLSASLFCIPLPTSLGKRQDSEVATILVLQMLQKLKKNSIHHLPHPAPDSIKTSHIYFMSWM